MAYQNNNNNQQAFLEPSWMLSSSDDALGYSDNNIVPMAGDNNNNNIDSTNNNNNNNNNNFNNTNNNHNQNNTNNNNNNASSSSNNSKRPAKYENAAAIKPTTAKLSDLKLKELQAILVEFTGDSSFKHITNKKELLKLIDLVVDPNNDGQSGIRAPEVDEVVEWKDIVFDPKKDSIAEGAFGEVFRGKARETPCAIKIMKNRIRRAKPGEIRKEIEVLKAVNHPHVCMFLGCSLTPEDELVVLMELMKGDLEQYLKQKHKFLSLEDLMHIASDVARGLNWLHLIKPTPIIHLDLKLENILYDSNGVMKVADFGLSALIPEDSSAVVAHMRTPGNVGHMAPEIIDHKPFSTKADVFSYGTLLWEILKGHEWEEEVFDHLEEARIPIGGNVRQTVKNAVLYKGFRPKIDQRWPNSIKNLLNACWQKDPEKRPTMSQILSQWIPKVFQEIRAVEVYNWLSFDKVAHNFWFNNFPQNCSETAPGVPFSTFSKQFYRTMKIRYPKDPNHIPTLFLKLALNAMHGISHSSSSNASSSSSASSSSDNSSHDNDVFEEVKLSRFGQVVAAFGPLTVGKGDQFLSRISSVLNNRWFHPSILTQKETVEYLHGQKDGTFVVRFSSKPRTAFTIARVRKGKLCQTRISRHPNSGGYIIEDKHFKNKVFKSLGQIISTKEVCAKLGLKDYVRFSLTPGQKILIKPLNDDDSYGIDDHGDLVLDILQASRNSN